MKLFNFFKHAAHRDDPFLIRTDAVKHDAIPGIIRRRWIEGSMQVEHGYGTHAPLQEFLGTGCAPRNLWIMCACIALFFVLIVGRIADLQLWEGAYYRSRAEHNRIRITPVPAGRGIIYDAEGVPLVRNVSTFRVNLLPQDIPAEEPDRTQAIDAIARLLSLDPSVITQKLDEFKQYKFQNIALLENVDYDTAVRLTLYSKEVRGINISNGLRREYLIADASAEHTSSTAQVDALAVPSLAAVLGYEGKITADELSAYGDAYAATDLIGKTGLEKSYEKSLRGIEGKKEIEVNALGKPTDVIAEEPPRPGKDIYLHIRMDYQTVLEHAVDEELAKIKKRRASAMVIDPNTGAVLALVNEPSFDNNAFAQGISDADYKNLLADPDHPLFTRAWSGSFPSGSVIKPVIATAALSEGIIDRTTTFLSVGGLHVGKWFFPDWKVGGHGRTNVIKALAESVNTFFFIVGGGYNNFTGLGPERILTYLKKFGLANTLGIDLPGETSGFLPTPEWKLDTKGEPWYIGDTYNMSIGQGDVLVTPLQVASYTAAVANGGTLYAPRVVQSIVDTATKQKTVLPSVTLASHLADPQILAIVREGMRSAVTDGSARSLSSIPIPVAGKTGTAQWSKTKANHAWFTGFAPYDHPAVVITILIEEGGEGSSTAVPIAKQFLQWYATHP